MLTNTRGEPMKVRLSSSSSCSVRKEDTIEAMLVDLLRSRVFWFHREPLQGQQIFPEDTGFCTVLSAQQNFKTVVECMWKSEKKKPGSKRRKQER